jgi:hypothetical protein
LDVPSLFAMRSASRARSGRIDKEKVLLDGLGVITTYIQLGRRSQPTIRVMPP